MISAKIEADNLPEYYKKLYELQAGAHKPSYMLVHDEIRARLSEDKDYTYTELGINQGATLAAALLLNPPVVRAYDIKLGWYLDAQHLFEQYSNEKEIDYRAEEADSLAITLEPTDVLYIDTLHKYHHLIQELNLHANNVRKYIICHDTHAQKGLKQAVTEFTQKNPEWTIVTDCKENVGFMTIKRA